MAVIRLTRIGRAIVHVRSRSDRVAHRLPLPPAAPTYRHRVPHAMFRQRGGKRLPIQPDGAQRASLSRSHRLTVVALIAAIVAGFGVLASPNDTKAAVGAGIKVVIVVGPAGSSTSKYRTSAHSYASLARSYGASVTEIFSPNATWSKVRAAAQGANLFIYLGHGNGYPSPYGAFQRYTKDGVGLNATAGSSNYNTKYWGEFYVDRYIQMDTNAVVILNRLCYASGNSEWGSANPTKATAIKRVDNYGAGFLRTGARVVFAEAINSISYQIRALFTTNLSMNSILMTHPSASGARDFYFTSTRTYWAKAHMDPPQAGKYWRSAIGNLNLTASQWRAAAK
jgi:hypothetical protein